jgi:hypothetical protein
MATSKVEGHCRVCGTYGPLSKEHVPPQRAYNIMPYVEVTLAESLKRGPGAVPTGRKRQGGVGFYTLCNNCNNNFGSWYAPAFIEWCSQGHAILERTGGNPRLIYAHHVHPLRIIKQIIAMFFSINPDEFRNAPTGAELVRLLINREEKGLPPGVRLYAYYNTGGQLRYNSIASLMKFDRGMAHVFTELTFPPFGYVMTLESEPPDRRLFDISHFAYFDLEDERTLHLDLPSLPTHLPLSGDYRTLEEIGRGVVKDRSFIQGNSAYLLKDDGEGKPQKVG